MNNKNNQMKVLIIEDEKHAALRLEKQLNPDYAIGKKVLFLHQNPNA